eukprot:TRINITY_DN5524_c0_g1_i1.p1 TRINITY_DN5524_c0_g1~~TRINITY_DN5524_c0_g1_i1.p1  ORF type:complete len:430 (-),score=86.47 TRINITY_DN5524_c0_g1_i1:396-1685(-)
MQATTCVVARAVSVSGDMERSLLSVRPTESSALRFASYRRSLSSVLFREKDISNGAFITFKKNSVCVRAHANANRNNSNGRVAPLELESPTGQFLSQILKSHPHLLHAAIEEQLQRLTADRDVATQQNEPSTNDVELVLYRRIAELKAKERRNTLEEIMYAFIIQKFMDAGISMITNVSSVERTDDDSSSSAINAWTNQDALLEAVHSPEALEMIQEHLSLVLGYRSSFADKTSVSQISRLRMGQVYAASVMYGYFLKRVDQHFQLEKSMNLLPFKINKDSEEMLLNAVHPELEDEDWQETLRAQGAAAAAAAIAALASGTNPLVLGEIGSKPCKLKAYVMSFDPETLQRYASMRSKESVDIIEKHAEALFGRPEIRITHDGQIMLSKDKVIRISFAGLTSLILEAVTFGSFLWDVENHVESRYPFVVR